MTKMETKQQSSVHADSSPDRALVYALMVRMIRDAGLSSEELAQITGVSERQVSNWASGSSKPAASSRDRLLEVHYVMEALSDVYDDEGVDIWLHGRNRGLGGQRPIELLLAGNFELVLNAVERLRVGAMG
jgi:transcriptional regulator with XRE-family HTH domain